MRPLLTPEEMGRADRSAIDAGTSAETLMDRAGRAVARVALELAGGVYGRRIGIVCGKGNNGGDGIVAARVLRRQGCAVVCLSLVDASEYRGPARVHLDRYLDEGGRLEGFRSERLRGCDVIVDAVFGTGFMGPAREDAGAALGAINAASVPVVSVDIPSGVDGETGACIDESVWADVTVTIGAEKVGTAVTPGALRAGIVEVADIGISIASMDAWMVERADVADLWPTRAPDSHKRSVGSVALLAGSDAMAGAGVLSVHGCVRSGAGYVSLGSTAAVKDASALHPEVLCHVVSDAPHIDAGALDRFAEPLRQAAAVGIGPGLGRGPDQRALVIEALAKIEAPMVVDADALNVLEDDTDALTTRTAPTVLTPHPGELARLLRESTASIQAARVYSARTAASKFGCVVLLKGYRSIVADPSGRVAIDPMGGAELASAGTGDVLTGVVARLLAAGLDPFAAAWAGAYAHGLAGRFAGSFIGPQAVLATDVADALPDAISALVESPL